MLGSRITAVAYPLLVLAVTGSPLACGWSTFAAIAPSVFFYLPAGALVDRWDPRRVLFASELGRGAAISSIVISIALGRPSLLILIGAAATEQTLGVFSVLAERRFTRSLVKRDQATSALVLGETRTHLVVLLGRPIGALMFGLAWVIPFAADACTFVVAMIALFHIRNGRSDERMTFGHMVAEFRWRLRSISAGTISIILGGRARVAGTTTLYERSHEYRSGHGTVRHMIGEISEGFCWLRSNPFACLGLVFTTGTTFVGQAMIMVFFAEAHSQHLSSMKIGVVLAASGAGGVIGSVVASRLFPLMGYSLLQIQMLVWTLTFGALAYGWQSYWYVSVAMGFLGFAGALGNIAIDTFIIRNAGSMLARVISVDRLTSLSALALGPALGGALFENFGAQDAFETLFGITLTLVAGALIIELVRYIGSKRTVVKAFEESAASGGRLVLNDAKSLVKVNVQSADHEPRRSIDIQGSAPYIRAVPLWLVVPTILGPACLLSAQERQEAKGRQARPADLLMP